MSVMLDSDLAELYGVSTSRLNEQVKRNVRRFPDDFSFQLTAEEALMSQFAISKGGRGGRRNYPESSVSREWLCFLPCCAATALQM